MSEPRAPGAQEEVTIDGHRVVTYSYGAGDQVVFLLNGGPGLPFVNWSTEGGDEFRPVIPRSGCSPAEPVSASPARTA